MENHSRSQVVGAPYIASLIRSGALATNYFAVGHPSLPNYAELTSGQSFPNADSDCSPGPGCQSTAANLANSFDAAGLRWREYAESMPAACTTNDSGEYAVRHNPWVYYTNISVAECMSNVLPYTQLATDFSSSATTPVFSFITPNLINDMHDGTVAQGDAWLSQNVPSILNSPAFTTQHSLLVVTWDEDDESAGNNVAAIFAGGRVPAGTTTSVRYTHDSLLLTTELALGLGTLNANDADATPMTDIWGP